MDGEVGKCGATHGTQGVTDGKKGGVTFIMRERVRERKRFTRVA